MPQVQNIPIDKFTVATSVSIDTLAQGEIMDQLQYAIAKVFEDIADENTDAKAARTVSVKLEFKPTEQRSFCQGKATVKSSNYPNGKPIKFELNMHRTASSISASETYVEQGSLNV